MKDLSLPPTEDELKLLRKWIKPDHVWDMSDGAMNMASYHSICQTLFKSKDMPKFIIGSYENIIRLMPVMLGCRIEDLGERQFKERIRYQDDEGNLNDYTSILILIPRPHWLHFVPTCHAEREMFILSSLDVEASNGYCCVINVRGW